MSEATNQIYQLIPQVMGEIGFVGKSRKNQQQGYQFRGIDDVYLAIQPALVKFGVFIVPAVVEQIREERQTKSGSNLIYTVMRVKHTFYAPDGSNVEAVTVGEAMDSGDKSANKAMSAAMKYACLEVFAIPTEGDNDTENHTHDVKPKQQAPAPQRPAPASKPLASPEDVAELRKLIQRLPAGTGKKWLDKAKVDSFEKMSADTIGKCLTYAREHAAPETAAA